jgi:hypothetical protein
LDHPARCVLIGMGGVLDELPLSFLEALALATAGFHHRAIGLTRPIAVRERSFI